MSILIKGMEMPKEEAMTINIWPDGNVYILGKDPMMLYDAAVELPDHGDLIDRDVLPKYTGYALSANDVANAVINAKAVIPAERSEK